MYTKENVICFYDDERVSELIGKEVFFSYSPYDVIDLANDGFLAKKLVSADKSGFVVEDSDTHWNFIIGKKLEYRPFDSFEEFALAYDSVFDGLDSVGKCIYRGGFWLIGKNSEHRFLVKEFTNYGIVLESEVLDWEYVLANFLMPDMTPCGVKEE